MQILKNHRNKKLFRIEINNCKFYFDYIKSIKFKVLIVPYLARNSFEMKMYHATLVSK